MPLLVSAIGVLAKQSYAVLAATVRNEQTFQLFLDECSGSCSGCPPTLTTASRAMRTELLDLTAMDPSAPTFWDTALDAGTRVEIVRVTPS